MKSQMKSLYELQRSQVPSKVIEERLKDYQSIPKARTLHDRIEPPTVTVASLKDSGKDDNYIRNLAAANLGDTALAFEKRLAVQADRERFLNDCLACNQSR